MWSGLNKRLRKTKQNSYLKRRENKNDKHRKGERNVEKGAIEINAVDKNGEALKQYDSVIAHDGFEWRIGCITYSVIDENFVAHFEESWISFEDLNEVEKLNDVIAREVLKWQKVETHWGKDGKAFHDMPIEKFDAINYAAIILDQLHEDGHDVRVKMNLVIGKLT